MERYGSCFRCKRLLPLKYLEQIEYYRDHITDGGFHHKLICKTCKKKADEVFEQKI